MDQQTLPTRQSRLAAWHPAWLAGIFIHPRTTLATASESEKNNWLTPLILLTVLVLLTTLAAMPIRRELAQTGANLPEDFQYWSQEQQQQYMDAQAQLTSPTFLLVFPFVSSSAGLWIFWFLFSSILYLVVTLAGSRVSRLKINNLVAWAMLPFALRLLVQLGVALFGHQLVTQPGLSHLLTGQDGNLQAYLRGLLSAIDVYWLWFAGLVYLGARPLFGLNTAKTLTSVLVTLLVMLLLQGFPSLLSNLLSGLAGASTPIYF